MMRGNGYHNRPDPLMLLAAAVTMAVMMTTAVNADESFSLSPAEPQRLSTLVADGGLNIAPGGAEGGSLHISLAPPPGVRESYLASGGAEHQLGKLSDVFISLRFPW